MAKPTALIRTNNTRHMIITPVARLSFPQLFSARSFQDNPDMKKEFKCDLIFDSMDVLKEPYQGKKVQTPSVLGAISNVKIDQWGKDKNKWPKFNYPVIKKGDENTNRDGEVYAGYKGKIYFKASCDEKYPPKIIGLDGTPLGEKDVYGGCFVRAQLVARPYAFGANFGVRFVLKQIQKIKNGEKFGMSDDVFDVSEAENEDEWEQAETVGADSNDDDEDF